MQGMERGLFRHGGFPAKETAGGANGIARVVGPGGGFT
jgi:hypothetical protein